MTDQLWSKPVDSAIDTSEFHTHAAVVRSLKESSIGNDAFALAVNKGQYFQFRLRDRTPLLRAKAEQENPSLISESQLTHERAEAWHRGFEAGYKEALNDAAALNTLEPAQWHLPRFLEYKLFIEPPNPGPELWQRSVVTSVAGEQLRGYPRGLLAQLIEGNAQAGSGNTNHEVYELAWNLQRALILKDDKLEKDEQEELGPEDDNQDTKLENPKTMSRSRESSPATLSTIAEEDIDDRARDGGVSLLTEDNSRGHERLKDLLEEFPPLTPPPRCADIGRLANTHIEKPSAATKPPSGVFDFYPPSPTPDGPKLGALAGFSMNAIGPGVFAINDSHKREHRPRSLEDKDSDDSQANRAIFMAKRPSFISSLPEKSDATAREQQQQEKQKQQQQQPKSRKSSGGGGNSNSRLRSNSRRFMSDWRPDLSSWRK